MKNKKTNAPNILRLLGIIALVAVIGFSMASCFIVPDDDDDYDGGGGGGTTTYSLDGYWELGVSAWTGLVVHITGSTGAYTQLAAVNDLTQSAIDKGYIKVGNQAFRNLSKTGDRTWTGQELWITSKASAPNVATGTSWENVTITMNGNGLSFQCTGGRTWTKRQ
jgi:hypothetical protein